jgi:hypothetical protein
MACVDRSLGGRICVGWVKQTFSPNYGIVGVMAMFRQIRTLPTSQPFLLSAVAMSSIPLKHARTLEKTYPVSLRPRL